MNSKVPTPFFLKKDLINLIETRNLPYRKSAKKSVLEDILRKFEIEEMEKKAIDNKDPISLEEFKSWTLNDLLEKVFLRGYFYQPTTMKNYINSFNDIIHPTKNIRDPIFLTMNIPTEIISEFKDINESKSKLPHQSFEIKVNHTSLITNLISFPFYKIELHLQEDYDFEIETNLKKINANKYIIGCIPANITIDHCSYLNASKALDTSSTSQCLLVRIINLYQSQKMITTEQKGKTKIHQLQNLPFRCYKWISYFDAFPFIDTRCISECSKPTVYNNLLQELYNFE
jgi:hypothetical protein